MAYSYTTYSGDGSTTTFSFGGIPLINNSLVPVQAQLVVTVDGSVVAYTVSGTDVVLASAPVLGASVVVTRDTKEDDRYVDWMNTSQIDASVLNLDSDQLFFLAQEAKEIASSAIQTTGGQLDAGNQRVINVATGTQQTDGVNLAQLSAAVVGGVVSEFTAQGYVTYGAVSSDEVVIELTGLAGRVSSDINVYVEGVKLLASAYTVADFGQNLNLTIPSGTLSSGDAVQVVWATGLVTGQVNPNLILWDQIVDDTIPYTSLDVAPTDDGKFFTVTGGTPVFENIVVSDVTDFDSSVRAYSLSDFASPSGNLSMGGHRVTNVLDALDPTDAPNLAQVQLMIGSNTGGGTNPGTGTQGPPGPPGESAYDIWLDEGNSGTEADFLDSLKGEDGDPGSNGSNGSNGANGTSATVALGSVNTGAAGTDVIITNTGPDVNNAIFNFTIPRGDTGAGGGSVTALDDIGDVPSYVTGDGDKILQSDASGNLTWEDVPTGGGSGAVTSVNGQTGVVTVEELPDYSTATTGQILTISGSSPSWEVPALKVRTLDSLSDVSYFDPVDFSFGPPAPGKVLTAQSGGTWAYQDPTVKALTAGSNVTITDNGSGSFEIAASGSSGGGASAINDLSDVDTATAGPTIGDVLEWDGANWTPATPSSGGGGSSLKIQNALLSQADIETGMNTPGAGTPLGLTADVSVNGGFTTGATTITATGVCRIDYMVSALAQSSTQRWALMLELLVDGVVTGVPSLDYGKNNGSQGWATTQGYAIIDCGTGKTIGLTNQRPAGANSVNVSAGNASGLLTVTQLS